MSTPSSLASRRTAGLDDTLCGSNVGLSASVIAREPLPAAGADALWTGSSRGLAGAAGAAMTSGDSCAGEAEELAVCVPAVISAASGCLDPAGSCAAACVLPSPTTVSPWSSVPSATLMSSRGSPTWHNQSMAAK